MPQSSVGFNEDDEDDLNQEDALPLRTEARRSTRLTSPDFQKPKTDDFLQDGDSGIQPAEMPVLREPAAPAPAPSKLFPVPAFQATLDRIAEKLPSGPEPNLPAPQAAPQRREPAGDPQPQPRPVVQRRSAITPEIGRAFETLQNPGPTPKYDYREVWARHRGQETRGAMQYLKQEGIETRVDPSGQEVFDTHRDGSLKFKRHVGEPEMDPTTGRWRIQARDEYGQLEDIDLLSTNKTRVDRQTGEQYFNDFAGRRVVVGKDPSTVTRNARLAERKRLNDQKAASTLAIAQMRAGLGQTSQMLSELRKASPDPVDGEDALSGSSARTVGELENVIRNYRAVIDAGDTSRAARQSLETGEKQLAAWKAKHPGYQQLADTKAAGERQIRMHRASIHDARVRALALDGSPATSFLPARVAKPAGADPSDLDGPAIEERTARIAKQTRSSHSSALAVALQQARDAGIPTVNGRPIDDLIAEASRPQIRTAKAQTPEQLDTLVATEEFKALPMAQRVAKIRTWVDQSVTAAKDADPAWSAEKEKAFRAQFPNRPGFMGAVSELAHGIFEGVVDRAPGEGAAIIEYDRVPIRDKAGASKIIAEQREDEAGRPTSMQQRAGGYLAMSLREGPKSIVTSLATSLAGAFIGGKAGAVVGSAAGPGGAIVGSTLGTIGGGAAASGVGMYRIAANHFLRDLRTKVLKEKPNTTEAEWETIKAGVEDQTRNYALWEAVPEAISSAIPFALFKGAGPLLKGIPGIEQFVARAAKAATGRAIKTVATSTPAKLLATSAGEVATETATTFGQSAIEAEVGLRQRGLTLGESAPKRSLARPSSAACSLAAGTMPPPSSAAKVSRHRGPPLPRPPAHRLQVVQPRPLPPLPPPVTIPIRSPNRPPPSRNTTSP